MAEKHPTDALLDTLLAPPPDATSASMNPALPKSKVEKHPTEQLLDTLLTSKSLHEEMNPITYDAKADWDGAREALDAAVFHKFSADDPERTKQREIWLKDHGKQALAAGFLGQTAPGVVLSGLAGQGVFRAGQVASWASKNPYFFQAAKFLTGAGEGGPLARLTSSATWGAGQGAITGAYGKAMGQPQDVGSEAILGGTLGPVTNMLFAPYRSNIAPGVGKLARDWSAMNLPLSAAQLPGAPPVLRALSKVWNMNKSDIGDVTASLMRSTGSKDTELTAGNLDRARTGIKAGLDQAGVPHWVGPMRLPSREWNNATDDAMPARFNDALNVSTITPQQAQAVRQAQNQWHNSLLLDDVERNSTKTPGLASTSALASAVRNTNYPVSPDVSALARGSEVFLGGGGHPPSLGGALTSGAVGGVAAEGLTHAMPFLEQVMPHLPLLAHGATAYGAANAAVAPLALPFMMSPLYRKLLTSGGLGPVPNPLLPSIVQNPDYQGKVSWMKDQFAPVSPAEGATRGAPDVSSLSPYARQLVSIESDSGRAPDTMRGKYIGLGQWGPDERSQYGITDPMDVGQNARAIDAENSRHSMLFANRFGRQPSPGELYLMHQQGASGGPALMAGGDTPAAQVRGLQAIKGNLPADSGLDPSKVTARQFAQYWINRFESGMPRAGVQVAPGPTSSGFSSVLQPITGPGPSQDEIKNVLAGGE